MLTVFALKNPWWDVCCMCSLSKTRVVLIVLALKNPGGFVLTVFVLKNPGGLTVFALKNPWWGACGVGRDGSFLPLSPS